MRETSFLLTIETGHFPTSLAWLDWIFAMTAGRLRSQISMAPADWKSCSRIEIRHSCASCVWLWTASEIQSPSVYAATRATATESAQPLLSKRERCVRRNTSQLDLDSYPNTLRHFSSAWERIKTTSGRPSDGPVA